MKHWGLDEANAALPEVQAMLKEARAARRELMEEETHMRDLQIVYGDAVAGEDHMANGEFLLHQKRLQHAAARMNLAMDRFEEMGIDVKDVERGLVDFLTRRGTEDVLLCWLEGEAEIRHWHTKRGGFKARRPVVVDPTAPTPTR